MFQEKVTMASINTKEDEEVIKIIHDLKIPTLKLAYPTSQDEIIELIDKTNIFLKELNSINEDNLTVDLYPKKEKCPIDEFKKILDNLI